MVSESNPQQTRKRDRVQGEGDSDDRVDPPTSQSRSPPSTRLANIPKEEVENASHCISRFLSPTLDDETMVDFLPGVWIKTNDVLAMDPDLKIRLASREEFHANVARKGQKTFFDSLRAMAGNYDTQGSKAWENLFEDGTSSSLGPSVLISFSV